MFTYLANDFSPNWLQSGTINSTTTITGVDLSNAIGPVLLSVRVPSGGSGTLALQPVMSTDNATWVNVPAAAIQDSAGNVTTFSNTTSAASTQNVYLQRDQLERYVSITCTPVVSASQTVNVFEGHLRAYTSTTV